MDQVPDCYGEDSDEEITVKMRNPLINHEVPRKGPNWGFIGGIVFCAGFWGYVLHLLGWF